MSRFDSLTKYLTELDGVGIGSWVIDKENDGTAEHPIQMPFVNYSTMVRRFIDDVHLFVKNNRDFGLNRYRDILEQNGLEWGKSMTNADVSTLDAQCVMTLIVRAVRAERFCDGALLSRFKDGSIKILLERLKEFD